MALTGIKPTNEKKKRLDKKKISARKNDVSVIISNT